MHVSIVTFAGIFPLQYLTWRLSDLTLETSWSRWQG